MAGLVTVYRAIEADVPRVVAYLENRCLHPVVLDDAEKMGPYRRQAHEIRIAVPETEQDMAVRLLEQMQRQEQLRLFPLIKKTNAVIWILLAVLGVFAIVGLLDTQGRWFVGFQILAVLLAALALIRWAWGGSHGAASGKKPDRE